MPDTTLTVPTGLPVADVPVAAQDPVPSEYWNFLDMVASSDNVPGEWAERVEALLAKRPVTAVAVVVPPQAPPSAKQLNSQHQSLLAQLSNAESLRDKQWTQIASKNVL